MTLEMLLVETFPRQSAARVPFRFGGVVSYEVND